MTDTDHNPAGGTLLTRPILILVADGFADWEIALLTAAAPDYYGADVRLSSLDGGEVTSMGGLRVTGVDRFAPTGTEVVVVCGGVGFEAQDGPQLIARMGPPLRQARADGAAIAGICAAVRVLADAGLLDGKRHTSNNSDWLNAVAPGYAGSDLHVDQPQALRDGDTVTAPGTAPVSFAAEVLAVAGLPAAQADEFRGYLAAEHGARRQPGPAA